MPIRKLIVTTDGEDVDEFLDQAARQLERVNPPGQRSLVAIAVVRVEAVKVLTADTFDEIALTSIVQEVTR